MKKLFLTLVALIVATMSYAQNTLVATLSHGENITMYYGTYALRDAVNAAVSGDVINLSGGAFLAVNITKGITLRGTGIDDAAPTYISGDFTINVATDDANRLSMEGIHCTGGIMMQGTFNSPYFLKCQFYHFYFYDPNSSPTIKNAMFGNCRITGGFELTGASTVQFINSYVSGFKNQSEGNSAASFVNCVINLSNPNVICNSQILNCILYCYSDWSSSNISDQLPSSNIATNCVAIGYYNLFGAQAANTKNSSVNYNEYAKVFKNFTGTYSDSQIFELSDEARTKYLGNDGTEVGLYGGILPYNTTPSYPQITKMKVASKTTADGKLSVEIEVSAAE